MERAMAGGRRLQSISLFSIKSLRNIKRLRWKILVECQPSDLCHRLTKEEITDQRSSTSSDINIWLWFRISHLDADSDSDSAAGGEAHLDDSESVWNLMTSHIIYNE